LEKISEIPTAQVIGVVDHDPCFGGEIKRLDVLDERSADDPIDTST